MTPETYRLLHDLMDSPLFRQALAELAEREMRERTDRLRAAIRAGNTAQAAQVEGEISAFESLPSVFRQHAEKYTSQF